MWVFYKTFFLAIKDFYTNKEEIELEDDELKRSGGRRLLN